QAQSCALSWWAFARTCSPTSTSRRSSPSEPAGLRSIPWPPPAPPRCSGASKEPASTTSIEGGAMSYIGYHPAAQRSLGASSPLGDVRVDIGTKIRERPMGRAYALAKLQLIAKQNALDFDIVQRAFAALIDVTQAADPIPNPLADQVEAVAQRAAAAS